MSTVHLIRQHTLEENQVRQHIEELAQTLASKLAAEYRWQGDRLEFSRTGASGYLQQKPGEVEIYLKLGLLLSPLKGVVEEQIDRYLDAQFAGEVV